LQKKTLSEKKQDLASLGGSVTGKKKDLDLVQKKTSSGVVRRAPPDKPWDPWEKREALLCEGGVLGATLARARGIRRGTGISLGMRVKNQDYIRGEKEE